jgi:hypothetical protein
MVSITHIKSSFQPDSFLNSGVRFRTYMYLPKCCITCASPAHSQAVSYIYIYIYIYTHAYTHIYIHTSPQTYTHANPYTYKHAGKLPAQPKVVSLACSAPELCLALGFIQRSALVDEAKTELAKHDIVLSAECESHRKRLCVGPLVSVIMCVYVKVYVCVDMRVRMCVSVRDYMCISERDNVCISTTGTVCV